MAYELYFPNVGTLDFKFVSDRLGVTAPYSLRTMASRLRLTASDVFPDDFYGKKYFGFNQANIILPQTYDDDRYVPFVSYNDVTINITETFFYTTLIDNGVGSKGILIGFANNNTSTYRTGSLEVTDNVTGETITFNVNQIPTTTEAVISISQTEVNLGSCTSCSSGSNGFSLSVDSKKAWSVTGQTSWLTIDISSGGVGHTSTLITSSFVRTDPPKSATLVFRTTDGLNSVSLVVNQD